MIPKLLQVFNQYLESGGEEVWVNKMAQLGGDGYELSDLRFHSGAWIGKGAPSRLTQAIKAWDNPDSRRRLRDAVAENRPDALLFHNLIPVGSFGLYQEAATIGLPVMQYVHNFRPFSPSGTLWLHGRVNDAAMRGNIWPEVLGRAWESSFLKTLVLAHHQQRMLRSGRLDVVRKWIAVSEFMRRKFVEAGLPAEKVVALRHCWKPNLCPEPTREGGHYLFLGRLVPEKGTNVLIEAWRILEKRLGDACPRLVIAGSGIEEAKMHAASNRVRKVVCVGFVAGEQKDELLASCRALVAPSIWWEPLGLIVYEAYDAAKPVLAASSGGLTETVLPGVTGYLHEPGSAERLADDVERLESSGPKHRAVMGRAGRDWLLENASPDQWREDFMAIVKNLS